MNSANITGNIKELDSIKKEIKRLSTSVNKLKRRKKELEQLIVVYLESKNSKGVKYNGNAYFKENKVRRTRKKKEEKTNQVMNVLNKYNVTNAGQMFQELSSAFSGNKVNDTSLKIAKIKN